MPPNATYYRRSELDAATLTRSADLICTSLAGGRQLTRKELRDVLSGRRRGARRHAAARPDRHVVRARGADLQRRDARQAAHVRARGRAGSGRPRRSTATRRSVNSHAATSPATARPEIADFAWWSGLTKIRSGPGGRPRRRRRAPSSASSVPGTSPDGAPAAELTTSTSWRIRTDRRLFATDSAGARARRDGRRSVPPWCCIAVRSPGSWKRSPGRRSRRADRVAAPGPRPGRAARAGGGCHALRTFPRPAGGTSGQAGSSRERIARAGDGAARRATGGAVADRRPDHLRASRRFRDRRRGLDRPGIRRRALPYRPRRARRGRSRRRRNGRPSPSATRGCCSPVTAGSRPTPAGSTSAPDLPRIIRAGRHVAAPKRYIRNFGVEVQPELLVETVTAQAAYGDGWVKIVGDWIDRTVGDLQPCWPTDVLAEAVAAAHAAGARVTTHVFGEDGRRAGGGGRHGLHRARHRPVGRARRRDGRAAASRSFRR